MSHLRNYLTFILALFFIFALSIESYSQSRNKRGESINFSASKETEQYAYEDAYFETNLKFGPLGGSHEMMARTYLQSNAKRFNMKESLNDVELAYIQESPAGYHVNFDQIYQGVKVYRSDIVVSIDKTNHIEFFISNYKPNFTPPATVNPQISSGSAIDIARRYLEISGGLHGEQTSELMIKVEYNIGRLVYRVVVPAFEPRGDWEVFVDAITGEVFRVTDMTCFHSPNDNSQDIPKQKKPDFPALEKFLPSLSVHPGIKGLTDQVSVSQVTGNMRTLEKFKLRYASSAEGRDSLAVARNWIISKLQSYGFTDVVQHNFIYNSNTLQNIVVTKNGTRFPDTMVVLGGHYDTVNGPGVDDNGSGTSLLLEVARIIAKRNFEYTIKLIFFSAEEQGYIGSNAYVQNVAVAGNHKIKVMINADMIGYSGGTDTIKVEKDTQNPPGNNVASAAYTDTLAKLTELYSTLKTKITNAYGSDYVPFQNAGYVITGFFENIQNPYYHTVRDSLKYVDTNYVTQVTKGALAGLSHFAKLNSGSGLVFDPDPLTTAGATYGTGGFVDPGGNDADTPELNGQRVLRALPDLSFSGGVYRLTGPYINVIDWDPPTIPPVTSAHPDSFRYTRSHDGFEDVMLYYHTDLSQRWIQSLGFTNIQNTSIGADAHGHSGADNSSYTPSTNRMSFGDGGVDDAEDADVIWHEYGHAIHHGSKPGWSGSGQQGALGEGFGDYWAESYSRSLNFWLPSQTPYFWVFDWDGHNPFWAGRVLNYAPLYPGGLVNQVHTDGQMWSSTLMNIWNQIGRQTLDKLVLQSHFYLATSGVTMKQNAEAVIQADRNLNGGANVPVLVYWFGQRGFINPNEYIPSITHTPRGDSENPFGPFNVTALIYAGGSALDTNSIKVFWTRGTSFTDSISMTRTANSNEWTANIPGNGSSATYKYYIYAKDITGGYTTHPVNAPANFHSFFVGDDLTKPVIVHTALRNQPKLRWPASVRASITDNLGVDSAWVEFKRLRGNLTGNFGLRRAGGNNFEGMFTLDTNQVVIGDTIQYKIIARDIALTPNIATSPSTGNHSFAIISTKGIVLVVDDDGTLEKEVVENSEKGTFVYKGEEKGITGRLIQRTLVPAGYIVDTVSFASHNPAEYPNYDIVVWTGGIRGTGVFGDAAKRNALVNRALTGGKIWIEGGEKDYVFRWQTTQVDVNFRRHVLHDSSWLSDVTSSNLVITQPSHAIFNTPNPITGPVAFTGTGIGVRDAMRLIPGDIGAYKVAGWSIYATQGPDTCAMIIYDNNPNPLSAQIVNQLFALGSITDTTVAKQLIENTAEYLMTPEPPPTGGLTGVVTLNDTLNWSGIMVKIQGLSLSHTDSVVTGSNGAYSFSGLYSGNYRVTVSKSGYVPASLSRDTTVGTTVVSGFNFALNRALPTTVAGKVTLAGTTNHSGVTVSIVGQGLSSVTDPGGNYSISNVLAGNIKVQASKLGYQVIAKDTVIANGASITINFMLGEDPTILTESFEGGTTLPSGWSTAVVTTGATAPAWSIITGPGTNPAAPPLNGTRQARFNSYSATAGSQARLTTKRLAFPAGGSRMTFGMYRDNGYTTNFDSITVQATTGDSITGPWTRLGNYIRYSPTNEWKKDSVDLTSFGGQSKVFLSFLATSRYGNNMYLDQIDVFSIVTSNFVTVTSPNGGEQWLTGQQYAISWNHLGVDSVKIEYSTNGGSSWTMVINSTPAKTDTELHQKYLINGADENSKNVNKGSYLWTVPNTPTTNALIKVTAKNNPSLFDQSDALFSIVTTLPPTWTSQTSPVTTVLNSVKAISNTVAWACGYSGRVLRTTNGGTNWVAVTNPSSIDNSSIEAIDANTAFVLANPSAGGDARMYKTTNGGSSWTLVYQSTAPTAYFNVVKMFDAINGYAQGDPIGSPLKYMLLKTTNGGNTWEPAADLAPASADEWGWNNSMYWINNQYGWFGSNFSRIYYTTNGGSTWQVSATSLTESPSVYFKDVSNGLAGLNAASNSTPTIARSTNGGAIWANISSPIAGRVFGLDGYGDKVWATSAANIIRTTNLGNDWTTQYTGTGTGNWYHLSMVKVGSDIHGWAVRSNGEIMKYTELGAVSVLEDELIPEQFELFQNYPNPFNPSTRIKFALPVQSNITIEIYNVLGQKVRTLINEERSAGYHAVEWNGRNDYDQYIGSGVYYVKFNANGGSENSHTDVRKMIMMK